jgi:hypothetical protein
MSKKHIEESTQADALPFFAHLLSAQGAQDGGPKPAPTYHCLDSECTKKYPSDDDETTSPTWDR